MTKLFETEITRTEDAISGPYRVPRQMLQDQTYDGHASFHDDDQAQQLGFTAGPIEAPTHFSQFEPLLIELWGQRWLETGCISAHFKTMVIEGEEVKAFVAIPEPGATITSIWATKKTGEPVLEGTVSLGPNHPETELERLLTSRPTPENLVILEHMPIGQKASVPGNIHVDYHQHLGDYYPFTLAEKLKLITESCPWYTEEGAKDSPWGRPILPMEMIGPLANYSATNIDDLPKRPVVGMFCDMEIKLIKGPLFVGQNYRLEKEVIGLGESRRIESTWVKNSIIDADSGELVAVLLLHGGYIKQSYPHYEAEAAAMGKPTV